MPAVGTLHREESPCSEAPERPCSVKELNPALFHRLILGDRKEREALHPSLTDLPAGSQAPCARFLAFEQTTPPAGARLPAHPCLRDRTAEQSSMGSQTPSQAPGPRCTPRAKSVKPQGSAAAHLLHWGTLCVWQGPQRPEVQGKGLTRSYKLSCMAYLSFLHYESTNEDVPAAWSYNLGKISNRQDAG